LNDVIDIIFVSNVPTGDCTHHWCTDAYEPISSGHVATARLPEKLGKGDAVCL
jgi:hypothetical protein